MSYLVSTPAQITAAAGNLDSIGSTLQEATAAASAPTTGIAAAAADEVSTAVSELFTNFGREFQALSSQASSYHAEFVRLLDGGAAAYTSAEIANAERVFESAVGSASWTPNAAAAAPGGAYGQLVTNTLANLQALGSDWAADPFPFLRQFLANQQGYAQQIATAIANIPANLPNLPAAIQAAIRQILSFNAAAFVQQFISTQIGFAQTFATAATNGISGLVAGLPQYASGLQLAFQQLLAGNYTGAVSDFGTATLGLLVTGVDTGPVVFTGSIFSTLTATVNPTLLGPLGDFFTIMNIPGQEAQYLTNLIPPSIPRQIAQNFTNVLDTLTIPSIEAQADLTIATGTADVKAFFGLPLVATYAAAGAPLATLNAMATSAEAFAQEVSTGNYVGAAGTLFDAPAVALNGLLNGNVPLDTTINIPTGLPAPYNNIAIVLHLPSDGLLVPPHPATATIDIPTINPIDVTILGTPFSGLVPLLVNYAPQQLAAAIAPA
ncbi:PE family protein [Mycobacterium sp. ML4]